MRVAIGCDHIGVGHKQRLVEALQHDGHAVLDLGTYTNTPVDYPPLVRAVVNAVLNRFVDVGVLLCERGTGCTIAANKFKGIRAAYGHDAATARSSREREDTNVLCVPVGVIDPGASLEIVWQWLAGRFSDSAADGRQLQQIGEFEETFGGPSAHPQAPTPTPAPATPAAATKPAAKEAARETPKPAPAAAAGRSSGQAAEWPAAASAAPVETAKKSRGKTNVADVETFIASLPDANVRALTSRALEFFTSRFPGIEGAPSPLGDGFTLTLNGEHASSVYIGKGLVWFEAGPDRIPSSKIKDLSALESAMNLPSVVRALQGIVP
jgi:ribose 5-phosphate isomerase B